MIFRKDEKLQVLLSGAVSTNELPIVATVMDGADGGRTSSKTVDAISTGATPVDVFLGQKSGRRLRSMSVHNADTANATVTVRFYNAIGTTRTVWKGTLATLETLSFDENRGWYTTDSNGAQKSTASTDSSEALSAATSGGLQASTGTSQNTSQSTLISALTSQDTSQSTIVSANRSIATSQDVSQSTNVSTNLSTSTSQDTSQSALLSVVKSTADSG